MKCTIWVVFPGHDILIKGFADVKFINNLALMVSQNVYLSEESFVKATSPAADNSEGANLHPPTAQV